MLFKVRGKAFCVNYGEMKMGVICEFYLAPYKKVILNKYDVLPIPKGFY
ncbi:MAG: hypothetical protein ACR5LF_00650 [Symbiopectobacterium sp.]